MTPSVSVVIPNYNGVNLLPQCLRKLEGFDQIIVVDDASTDESTCMLRNEFPHVTVVARSSNGGFSVAANDGIRVAQTELVLMLNTDVEVAPGLLTPIIPMFDNPEVFAVSPRILVTALRGLDEGPNVGFWRRGMMLLGQKTSENAVASILYACACAAVYRRSMLLELGGFDEAYSPFYWEDTDLGYRAWKRGWGSYYQPGSQVFHHHGASICKFEPEAVRRVKARNFFLFVWRNLDDRALRSSHLLWLPAALLRRAICCDRAFIRGFADAYARRREATTARVIASATRKLSDREIFQEVGVRML